MPTDVDAALQVHHRAVEAFLADGRAVPAGRWSQPRAPGKWSPGQVTEHVTLAYEFNRRLLHGDAPPGVGAPRPLRPLIRKFLLGLVLRRGRFIPGSKSPVVFRPGPSPSPQSSLLDRLEAAARAFESDARTLGVPAIDHPFFGRTPLVDFVRLQEIHTLHHRAQLSRAAG